MISEVDLFRIIWPYNKVDVDIFIDYNDLKHYKLIKTGDDYNMEHSREISNELVKEVIKIRRYLHKYPEISEKEYNTCKYIRNYLNNIGIIIKWLVKQV